MNSVLVVVLAKGLQFPFKVKLVPEEQIIQKLPTNRSYQPLYEWMRCRRVRDALDLFDLEDSQIGLPSVITEQGIIVGAQVFGNSFGSYSLVKQTTECNAINIALLYTKADDTPSELIHDNEYPVTS